MVFVRTTADEKSEKNILWFWFINRKMNCFLIPLFCIRWFGWLLPFPIWSSWCCSSVGPLCQGPGGAWSSISNLIGGNCLAPQWVSWCNLTNLPFISLIEIFMLLLSLNTRVIFNPPNLSRCGLMQQLRSSSHWVRASACSLPLLVTTPFTITATSENLSYTLQYCNKIYLLNEPNATSGAFPPSQNSAEILNFI